jgi:hypothetical protein
MRALLLVSAHDGARIHFEEGWHASGDRRVPEQSPNAPVPSYDCRARSQSCAIGREQRMARRSSLARWLPRPQVLLPFLLVAFVAVWLTAFPLWYPHAPTDPAGAFGRWAWVVDLGIIALVGGALESSRSSAALSRSQRCSGATRATRTIRRRRNRRDAKHSGAHSPGRAGNCPEREPLGFRPRGAPYRAKSRRPLSRRPRAGLRVRGEIPREQP